MLADLTPAVDFRHVKPALIAPVVALAEVAILFAHPVVPPGTVSEQEPIAAATYLRHHAGRVFNAYHWGGYLIYRQVPVFVDGRTDFYLPSHVLQNYLAVKDLTKNPDVILGRYRVRYVVWPPGQALDQYLLTDRAAWKVVLDSRAAMVFEHVGPWGAQVRTVTRGSLG